MSEPINLVHRCDECGETFPIAQRLLNVQGMQLCPECYEHVRTCDSCGRKIGSNHKVYFMEGTHLCKRCYKATLLEEAVIEDMSWVPGADYGYAPVVKRIKEDV